MRRKTHRRDEAFGKEHELIMEVIATGCEAGAEYKFWRRLADNPELFSRVVAFAARWGRAETTDHKLAREIMGKDFFGIQEAINHLGASPSEQQIVAMDNIPFSESLLRQCNKGNHILGAVFRDPLLNIKEKHPKEFYSQGWFENELFAKKMGWTGWCLLRKTHAENSLGKTWDDQRGVLGADKMPVSARVLVYLMVGHFLNTGERIFPEAAVRSSCMTNYKAYVNVAFEPCGLILSRGPCDYQSPGLGMAVSTKFDFLKPA